MLVYLRLGDLFIFRQMFKYTQIYKWSFSAGPWNDEIATTTKKRQEDKTKILVLPDLY